MAETMFERAINALFPDEPAPPTDRLGAATAHLSSWLTEKAGDEPCWFCTRDAFASRLNEILRAPNRLNQGSYDFCMPAAFLNCALRRFPERVAQFATSVYDSRGRRSG